MSRVAGLFAFAIALLVPFGPAIAGSAPRCWSAEVAMAHYQEQICQRGAGGYSTCRWIDREHIVRTPRRCATTTRTGPATRGAFPSYRRSARRG